MKILILFIAVSTLSAFAPAQTTAEKEVSELMDRVRVAIKNNDVAALDAALAPDYSWSSPQGTVETRAEFLDYYRKHKAKPTYKILESELNNAQTRVFGDIAIVTGSFRMVSEFNTAHPNDPPHVDEGRYTGVVQKRDGRWHVLAEHDSEKPHDKATMEKLVAALGRSYTGMIKRNDADSIAKVLADDYIVTDEEGKRLTKAEDLATYKDRAATLKIETVEYKDQMVRMLTGSVAVDHSTIRFTGTSSGKPFDITERITTTWQFRDGRWLIVADHFSFVKP